MPKAVSYISNTEGTHKEFLLEMLGSSEEIIIAVGFLKRSGLRNIEEGLIDFIKNKDNKSRFYIGLGLGETEPEALIGLHKLLKGKSNHHLVLCTPHAGIFHPKVYIFRNGDNVTITVGSSNLTQHGWVVNDELSMVTNTTLASKEYLELLKYFKKLDDKYYEDDVEKLIQRYKKERSQHFDTFQKAKTFRFKRRETMISGIDMPRLKRYFELYKDSDDFIEPVEREKEYELAKNHLNVLASNKKLTQEQFHTHFGPLVGHDGYESKLWHSGSIHRKTYATLEYADSFREIVRTAKRNASKPVSVAFDKTTGALHKLKQDGEISGIGPNIITEILMTYHPEKFANLNKNPLTVLNFIGRKFPSPSSFKGSDYAEYISLIDQIREELKMKSFLEIDSFFNYVYWNEVDE